MAEVENLYLKSRYLATVNFMLVADYEFEEGDYILGKDIFFTERIKSRQYYYESLSHSRIWNDEYKYNFVLRECSFRNFFNGKYNLPTDTSCYKEAVPNTIAEVA